MDALAPQVLVYPENETPSSRIHKIEFEDRTFKIEFEDRTYKVT